MKGNENMKAQIENRNIFIVNNCEDLSIVHDYLIQFAKSGIIHEDIIDIFSLKRITDGESVKIIVNWN